MDSLKETRAGLAPINGADLYFETKGRGKALLFIHAGVGDSRMWDHQFGMLFQKFANYRLRGAGLISLGKIKGERFKELIFECNKGNLFRFFEDKATAEKWLAQE